MTLLFLDLSLIARVCVCKMSRGIDLELTNTSVYLKIQKVGDGSRSFFFFFLNYFSNLTIVLLWVVSCWVFMPPRTNPHLLWTSEFSVTLSSCLMTLALRITFCLDVLFDFWKADHASYLNPTVIKQNLLWMECRWTPEVHDICRPYSFGTPCWSAKIREEMETEKINSWLLSHTGVEPQMPFKLF